MCKKVYTAKCKQPVHTYMYLHCSYMHVPALFELNHRNSTALIYLFQGTDGNREQSNYDWYDIE